MGSQSSFFRIVGPALQLGLLAACSSDHVSPSESPEATERVAEYSIGRSPSQPIAFYYDGTGRLVRWELSGLDEAGLRVVTLYTVYRYEGELVLGSQRFARKDDNFLKSGESTYEHDAAGRLTSSRHTTLLDFQYRPTREESIEHFLYDDQGRINLIVRSDGSSHVLTYDAVGDVVGETSRFAGGTTLTKTHAYGRGRNPFKSGFFGYGWISDSWAEALSEHDLIRTELRVDDGSDVVSSRERQVVGYTPSEHPTGWVETLVHGSDTVDRRVVTLLYTRRIADDPVLE